LACGNYRHHPGQSVPSSLASCPGSDNWVNHQVPYRLFREIVHRLHVPISDENEVGIPVIYHPFGDFAAFLVVQSGVFDGISQELGRADLQSEIQSEKQVDSKRLILEQVVELEDLVFQFQQPEPVQSPVADIVLGRVFRDLIR
jgi:hypothetical protein